MITLARLIPAFLIGGSFALLAVLDDDASWALILLLLLPIVVMIAVVVIVLGLQRRGHRWFPQPVRLLGADAATRRRVRRIVRRGQLPADEPDRELGLEMAQVVDRVRWNRWTMLFLVVMFAIQVVLTNSHLFRIFAIVYVVAFLPVLAWTWKMYARVHTLVREQATMTTGAGVRHGIEQPRDPG